MQTSAFLIHPRRTRVLLGLAALLCLDPGCAEDCTTPTPQTQPPVSAFTASSGSDGVDLAWTHPANADFRGVLIRCSPDSLPVTPFDGLPVLDGSGQDRFEGEPGAAGGLALRGLRVGVLYHFSAFAYSAGGLFSTAAGDTAVATDRIAPAALAAFWTEVRENAVRLHWTAPATADYHGAMLRWSDETFPAGPAEGTAVFAVGDSVVPGPAGGTMFIDHAGLIPGRTYYYAAFACDSSRNYSPALQDTSGVWTLLLRTSAENLIHNLHWTWETRAAAPCESLLARDYQFLFCEMDQPIAEKLTRDQEVQGTRHLFASNELLSLTLAFTPGEPTIDPSRPDPIHPERNLWTMTITDVHLVLTLSSEGAPVVYELEGGIEQFWFREEHWNDPLTGEPVWSIVEWREHDPAGSAGARGTERITWGQIKALF